MFQVDTVTFVVLQDNVIKLFSMILSII